MVDFGEYKILYDEIVLNSTLKFYNTKNNTRDYIRLKLKDKVILKLK